jgi:hypothetical protein
MGKKQWINSNKKYVMWINYETNTITIIKLYKRCIYSKNMRKYTYKPKIRKRQLYKLIKIYVPKEYDEF